MNTQSSSKFSSNSPLFQDRQLPEITPLNSWQRLTAGDERAERFEGLLRTALVVSLFCTVLICGLRFRPPADATDNPMLALPTVQLPQVVVQTPANVRAALPQTVALATPNRF